MLYIREPPLDVSDVNFLQDDVRSMADNLSEIIKLCRVENEAQVTRATQAEEDALEMQVISLIIVLPIYEMHFFFLYRIRDKERQPLSLVLQTLSKSFRHYTLPRAV
jgi:hypothetical protein